MVNRQRMEDQLILHEGLRLRPYRDTLGYLTIFCGYNVDTRGWEFISQVLGRPCDESSTFTEDDARAVLRADIDRIEPIVQQRFPEYANLSEVRQRVVLDMAYNMGSRALGFKNTMQRIREGNWSEAVRGLFASKWAHQVDDGEGKHFGRADRLGKMLLTNQDYTS